MWTRSVRTMAFDPATRSSTSPTSLPGPQRDTGQDTDVEPDGHGRRGDAIGPGHADHALQRRLPVRAGRLALKRQCFRAGVPDCSNLPLPASPGPSTPQGGSTGICLRFSNDATGQFFIGNWGHGCQSSTEAAEYQQANGAPFAESQHILRLHDNGPLTTILMPWGKTAKPTRTVTEQPCGTQVVQTTGSGVETTCFSGSMAQYSNGTTSSILTVYDASTQSAFGITASGGPQEVAVGPRQIVWTLSGIAAGIRSVTLPAGWSPVQPVAQSGNTFTVAFPGGAQTAPVSIVFTQ